MADQTMSFQGGQSFNVDSTGAATGANAAGSSAIQNLGSGNSFSSYVPPTTSNPVSGLQIANGNPLNFSPAAPVDTGASAVAGVIAGQNYSTAGQAPAPTSSTPALDTATANYNSASKTYTDLTANAPDESKMLTAAEQAAGTPAMKSQIDQLKTDLATTTAAYNNQYQNIGANGVEKGIPSVFYQGEQAAQQRQASVVISGKSAVLSALQGNYTEAENLAKQTADLQFKAAEDKITNAYNFLKLNQDTLTKAQANAIKTQADQQKTDLVVQKANVTTALSSGVQTQFWTKPDGTVVNTQTGQAYSTPKEAFAAGVLPDFSNAPKINPVGKSETKTLNGQSYHIVYDQAGNVLSKTLLGKAGKGTGTGSGTVPPITTTQDKTLHSQADQAFSQVKGADGFVSPDAWNKALAYYVSKGGLQSTFVTKHKGFINPADKQDYQGVK